MLQGAGCHIRRVCGVLQVIQTDSPVVPGRAHSGFEVWPYAFQELPPPSSRKGSFDPDPRPSVHTFEAPEWEAARPADGPSTSQRPSAEVEHVGKHPERASGVPTVGHVGELWDKVKVDSVSQR